LKAKLLGIKLKNKINEEKDKKWWLKLKQKILKDEIFFNANDKKNSKRMRTKLDKKKFYEIKCRGMKLKQKKFEKH
jgi:hypothetical protein